MGRMTLVLGGARSGKSRFAQERSIRLQEGREGQDRGQADVIGQAPSKGAGRQDVPAREGRQSGRLLYIATSEAGDEEMRQRIDKHRKDRSPDFKTIEAPFSVSEALARESGTAGLILIDCITLLLSNILLKELDDKEERLPEAENAIKWEIGRIIERVRESPAEFIIVSNELGLGVVPPTFLGRVFRDLAGFANQRLAAEADEVFFIVSGLAQKIK